MLMWCSHHLLRDSHRRRRDRQQPRACFDVASIIGVLKRIVPLSGDETAARAESQGNTLWPHLGDNLPSMLG